MAGGWRKLRVGYRYGRALASLVLVLMLSVPWRLAGRWRTSCRAIENAAWDILLRGFGIRVRCHGDVARIEVPAEDRARLLDLELAQSVYDAFKKIGFSYVSLDLLGYRMGSMNETLQGNQTE